MKQFIKKILLLLSFRISSLYKNQGIKLIYYHDIVLENGRSFDRVEAKKFINHMKYLQDHGYKAIGFDELETYRRDLFNNKIVLISFDDGYRSNYDIVFPIMKEFNMKFNIFLEVGSIDVKNEYLTWDMIKEMHSSGLVMFGAHTFNHKDSRYIDKSNVDIEIFKANKLIQEKLGFEPEDYCFPFGSYDKKIINYLDELKVYKRLYTSDGRNEKKYNHVTLYGRVGIENEDTLESFVSKLHGGFNLYYFSIRNLKKLMRGAKNEILRKN